LVPQILEFAARRAPGDLALVYGERRWTFGELHDRVERLAAGLSALTEPGDRVAVLSENTPEMVELYYAAPLAGVILTPLNYRLHPEEWAGLLEHADPSVLVGERALLDRVLPLAERFPGVRTVLATDEAGGGTGPYESLVGDTAAAPPRPAPSPHDPAWMLYTSGTTGRPKGALLTHANLGAAVTATAIARPMTASDVYLFPFPLCHVAGYNVLLFHLFGRPVVLLRRFDPGEVVEAIAHHSVTNVSLAPTMIAMLLDDPALGSADLSSLRAVGYGASSIPASVLERGLDALGCDFAQGYGMTELSGNAAFLDADAHRRGVAGEGHLLRAAGRPGPLVSIRVVDDALADVPPGDPGEIVVRGDQVTAGYWRDPDATTAAFAGGWFHTGDLGRFDDDGFLYVVDRKKDVIVTGGENVASREVEDVLHLHPAVREAAVVGVPDEHWGEAVCAVVVAREGATLDAHDLVELCRGHLAGFKKPRHVVVVDELPKNVSGKVLKHLVREQAVRRLAEG
jgi:acyl-CoA synthetase (AMP-forming)/AMP-acid ligase II